MSQILIRRIPQFFGIYLAGSWTTLEFTQWAVGRYSLSPNWEEVLVVGLLLCLPLILVLAWHHGAPGKQDWSLFEKIFLPLYIIAVPAILHHLYQDEDLGKTIETVMVADESGDMKKREIVKTQFLKSLIIYPLNNISGDESLDALASISSEVLNRDLRQNQFYSSLDISQVSQPLRSGKQSYKNIPLSFQINFAKQRARDYLINGSLNKTNNLYQISLQLYNSKNGRLLTKFDKESNNYFSAIDELSRSISDYFELSNTDYTDLPIEDLYTNNWQAFELYGKAKLIDLFGDKKQDAEQYYLDSLEQDQTFAISSFHLALFYLQQSSIVIARKYVSQAQEYQSYRLTERERFPINATSYFLNQQPKKGFQVLDQWSLLYPNETEAYLFKAQFAQFHAEGPEVAIENLLKVIELDPSQHSLWDQIGDIYSSTGHYEKALEAYEKYTLKNRTNPIAYKNLGDLYINTGNFDSSISNYQQALTLEPNNPRVLNNLARAYSRIGNFKNAEKNYLLSVKNSNTPAQLLTSKTSLSQFYWQYGKRQSFVKYSKEAFNEFAESVSETKALEQESLYAWQYFLSGEEEYAQDVVKRATSMAKAKKEDILIINSAIGQAMLFNLMGKAEESLIEYDDLLAVGEAYSAMNGAVINHFKGRSLYSIGEYEEALKAFTPIIERFPDRITFLEWIAKTHVALGDFDSALEMYEKILFLAPAYPNNNLAIAKVFIATNQIQKAKEHLTIAVDNWQHADSQFDEIIEAQQLLTSL